MKKLTKMLMLLAVVGLVAPGAAATTLLYETGFENFTTGNIDDQFGWSTVGGEGLVNTSNVISGLKSMTTRNPGTGTGDVRWTWAGDSYVVAEFKAQPNGNTTSTAAWELGDGSAYGTLVLFDSNEIQAFNGGTRTKLADLLNQTYKIKIVADAANQTYDVYVDDVLKADDFAFWQTTGSTLNLFRAERYSSTAVYMDDLTIIPEPGTMALLGLGGVGLLIRRRRRAQ